MVGRGGCERIRDVSSELESTVAPSNGATAAEVDNDVDIAIDATSAGVSAGGEE